MEKRNHQEQLEQEKRNEDRNRVAIAAGYSAVSGLLRLREDPMQAIRRQWQTGTLSMDEYEERRSEASDQSDKWVEERQHRLLDLRIAVDGFSQDALREELTRAHLMLEVATNMDLGGMSESELREVACNYILRCLASVGLNKAVPEPGVDYQRCWREIEEWYEDNDPRQVH
jgi:hypothetical protein